MVPRTVLLILAIQIAAPASDAAAAEHYGQVTFAMLPVPGASVTATQGDKTAVTITDPQGVYKLDLADGVWTLRVEMLGFETINQDVTVAPGAPPSVWELKIIPFEQLAQTAIRPKPDPTPEEIRLKPDPTREVTPDPTREVKPDPTASVAPNASAADAAEGFLVNGSVNNGAASPFAQLAAFGNNRRGLRSLYNGGLGVILGSSAFDARAFSFSNQAAPKPDYSDVQFAGTFGGPLRIPGMLTNGPNLFVLYQRTSDHTATIQPALMPTLLERGGDFSQTLDAAGRPVRVIDPLTRLPFPGNVIPRERLAPQAASLLGYYPAPNVAAAGRYNYQRPVLTAIRQDNIQSRITQPGFGRSQLFGNVAYQRTANRSANVFGFEDATDASGLDAAINWSYRFSPFFSLRLRYQVNRLTTETTPYFANRTNVSADAQIGGNDQEPVNWGPPKLTFASGIESLADAAYAFSRSHTDAWNAESFRMYGRHNLTFGGDLRWQRLTVLSQQDARGSFTFTGSATGSDLADFLLGIPHASAIAFGNADKRFLAPSYAAYITDDWRFGPGFTLNAGLRWEYEAPITERLGRLVNLDIAPGFSAVHPVLAADPVGSLTGRRYPDSLVRPDKRGIQPRVGVAWRPVAGSSMVVRGGYGIYRNTSVYQTIALLLAQQPPLSKTLSVENSARNPLTLANGFTTDPGITPNTFAVDPDFRVGAAHTWQASFQRDLPASLTVLATYLGTKGSHLIQQFLPNTYPAGALNPCPACPAGFVYVTSDGRSIRHAAQLQIRRRLRNGLTATVQYSLAKAMDDAAFSLSGSVQGSGPQSGGSIAQDWLNLDAEWAPSAFDQRHLVTAQFQYTTGVGVSGGALLTGVTGALVKGWTLTAQLNAGSGLPVTPVAINSVAGTGVTGTIRADVAGGGDVPDGYYANPASYAAPPPGRWGNAGRNSITGPAQFGLNAGITRTFPWGDRLNVDWRIDATNVLNRVTYSAINAIVGSPQFGLPNRANTMRKITSSVRFRF